MLDSLLNIAMKMLPRGSNPLLGAELEFYMSEASPELIDTLQSVLKNLCSLVPEEHEKQYEMRFDPTPNPSILAQDINNAKNIVITTAQEYGVEATFAARPFPDLSGSAMHIHINYTDNLGNNLFAKIHNDETPIFLHAVGGLCACMSAHMKYFAPHPESYQRFVNPGWHTPTKISWGTNNRTAAIRIPDTNQQQMLRRLEHRVPCADSDPTDVIGAIILGSMYGIQKKIMPPPPTYGLTFDEQYNLNPLPATLEEALSIAEPTELAKLITRAI